jgi:hypothetical protein
MLPKCYGSGSRRASALPVLPSPSQPHHGFGFDSLRAGVIMGRSQHAGRFMIFTVNKLADTGAGEILGLR